MNFNLLADILNVASRALPLIAGGIVAVLHLVGSDKHRTVAGDIAEKLTEAGEMARKVHDLFLNSQGVQHGDPSQDPPT
jgi:hypothetical protein